ncbi:MAG: hypothetical protein ABWK01_04650 [Infirmifilum sp.]
MRSSIVNSLLSQSLQRFERALASHERKYTVTQVAGRYRRGRGRGAAEGRYLHERFWGDLSLVLSEKIASTPLPLAWRFRFGWLYGVADQVLFVEGLPREVVELKSYGGFRRFEVVQAALYGLLVEMNWGVRPRVKLSGCGRVVEIENWMEEALQALEGLI